MITDDKTMIEAIQLRGQALIATQTWVEFVLGMETISIYDDEYRQNKFVPPEVIRLATDKMRQAYQAKERK